MKLNDIINDGEFNNIITNHIIDTLNSEELIKGIRIEYPPNSSCEWKIVCDCKSKDEIIFKLKRRR